MRISGEPDPFDEILANYLDQLDNGEPVRREALLLKHPELADQFARFFDDCDAVSQAIHRINDDDRLLDQSENEAGRIERPETGPNGNGSTRVPGQALNDTGLNEVLSCLQHLDELYPDDGYNERDGQG